MSFLELHNITKEFVQDSLHTKVLRGISLSLVAGETMAVLGPSGAGKSTLLHIMGTLDEPSSGELKYNQVNLFEQSDKKRAEFRNKELGFIFQFHHLLADFNALENVMMPLLIRGVTFKEAKEKAKGLIYKVGLEGKEDNRPNQLSGGEQQRVAIARALVNEPKLVLADEPTGNLDAVNGRKVFDLLLSLNGELKTTLVVVTHNEELAGSFSRILRIIDGKIAP